jgi:sulfhydrogenase subunit beta (sulfur reductase)
MIEVLAKANDVDVETRPQSVVEWSNFGRLIEILREKGYQVLGPRIRDGAIVYDELSSASDLPAGWTDEQDGGSYRLKKRSDDSVFGYAVGPHSWKKYLHPPLVRLWKASRKNQPFEVQEEEQQAPKRAFIGVRACELHAIAIQDKVFLGGPYQDPYYKLRRENIFIAAVNCGQAGGTCFCVSMHTGPKASQGFDLSLTEVLEDGRHYFVVETGTQLGAEVLAGLPVQPAGEKEKQSAERVVKNTADHMGRAMDVTDLKELLYRNYDHPRWEKVAGRCLTCGNCTMVCPTCFCTTVEDTTELNGQSAERWQKWDSCFTMDFSYIHGGSVRATPKSRYRQWMTHKLATWIDQFGTSGCVGCGRCITWCPVGIDITEETSAIRQTERQGRKEDSHGNGNA